MMNPCSHIPQMHRYHDGELPTGEATEAERHARECPACAAELAALQAMGDSLRSLAGPAQAPDLLMARIRRSAAGEAQRSVLRLAWSLTAAAAAVVLVCLPQIPWGGASDASAATTAAWEVSALALWTDSAPPESAEQLWARMHLENLATDVQTQEQP